MLCNAENFKSGRDVKGILEQVDLFSSFDPELLVMASNLPVSLPDRRAFAVAAALAGTPIDECVYVSANPGLLVAAAAAGMRAVSVGPGRTSQRPPPRPRRPPRRNPRRPRPRPRPSCSRARSRPIAARPTSSAAAS